MPYAVKTNPEIIFMQSVHQSIRMKCRRTSWKHVEPNIITYYCFDEHHKYSTIITQSAEILLLSHNLWPEYSTFVFPTDVVTGTVTQATYKVNFCHNAKSYLLGLSP